MNIDEKVTMIDNIFSSYLLEKNEKMFCKNLSTTLMAFSNKRFEISIVNNKISKEPFFGMRVFPSNDEMKRICNIITDTISDIVSFTDICERWRKFSNWVIEIDSRVFDRMIINFNPQELTAMLLHEIGHTIYSEKKIEMFYRVYKECRLRMNYAAKASARMLCELYLIPLTLVCGIRDWSITSSDLNEELFADQTVKKLGYGEYLISAFQKIIDAHGNSSGYSSESKKIASIEQSMIWCNLNISDLTHRKNKLKDELYLTGAKTNSAFIHNLISQLLNKLKVNKVERYTGNIATESLSTFDFVNENFVNENKLVYDLKGINNLVNMINSIQESANNDLAMEAFGRNKNKKPQVPTQLEVDTIFVEVDRIQNHADRRYVLDLIYNQEEKIEHFMELFKYNKDLKSKYEHKMNAMLKDLESMRQAVLSKRSFDKQYKVFVKYPEGYEG